LKYIVVCSQLAVAKAMPLPPEIWQILEPFRIEA
jgi:hypothetical protein